jgi:hypothetical protein
MGVAGGPLAHTGDPAGGAPFQDLVPATIVAGLGIVALVLLARLYRKGGARWLRRAADLSEDLTGFPAWGALPAGVGAVSLIVAVFGFYWDVSTHIDNGRDAGPFANPAHYFILAGLVGVAVAGYLSVLLGPSQPTRTSVRLADDWHAPAAGLLLLLCGVVALAGFPLDDVWHRLFGQDVTLWGPTHIQMIGGASLATLSIWALFREARLGPTAEPRFPWLVRGRDVALGGAFLLGLSTLQGEFDFGVPQFSLLYHPVLVMLAASIGLVTARIRLGRGGALLAVAFYLAVRGGLALLVGPVLGRSLLHFPLYLAEALLVEIAALAVGRHRQLRFGVVSGLLIGTVGLAAEWAWTHVWMPLPWPATLWPEGFVAGFLAAVGGGAVGGLIGRALAPEGTPRQPVPGWAAGLALLTVIGCLVLPGLTTRGPEVQATVDLQEVEAEGGRAVVAEVRLDPADAADGAYWFEALAWQGRQWEDGGLVRSDLEEVDEGVYRTTTALPVHGEWKALLRLHRGRSLTALPIFMPEDPGIPAEEIPAEDTFTRSFVPDKEILQREAVGGSVGLQRLGYALLLGIAVAWMATLAWGLRRIDGAATVAERSLPVDERAGPTWS